MENTDAINADSPALRAELDDICQQAVWRWKLERFRWTLAALAAGLAGVSYVWTVVVFFVEDWHAYTPWLLAVSIVAALGATAGAFFLGVDRKRVLGKIDHTAHLSDDALAAEEVPASGAPEFWTDRVLKRAVLRLRGVSWRETWPLRWPRYTAGAFFSYIAVLAILWALFTAYQATNFMPPTPDSLLQRIAAAQAVFDEWEEPEGMEEDEDWKQIQDMTRNFENELSEEPSDKEMFLELSKIEDKLREMMDKAEKESLAEHSEELAKALEKLNDTGKAATALRQKDFEKASEELKKKAEELKEEKRDPKKQLAKDPEAAAEDLKAASQQMKKAGQENASEALAQMAQAAQQNDSNEMAEGMEGMQRASQMENMRQNQMSALGQKMREMAEMKSQLGNGMRPGGQRGKGQMPQPGGLEAGTGAHNDPFGKSTELIGERDQINLSGDLGQGKSRVTTQKSDQGAAAQASGAVNVDFNDFEKLSREAIEDESIPLSHRETIHRYFQLIRPNDDSRGSGANDGGGE